MGFGITELIIVLVIVLVLFGAKRLRNVGSDLGAAVKGFKTAVKDEEKNSDDKSANKSKAQIAESESESESEVIEGEVTKVSEEDKV